MFTAQARLAVLANLRKAACATSGQSACSSLSFAGHVAEDKLSLTERSECFVRSRRKTSLENLRLREYRNLRQASQSATSRPLEA